MPDTTQILVAGAGLAGMSAAHHLRGRCTLVERAEGPGGLAVTEWDEGFGFDRTGHLMHLRDPAIRRWVTRLLGKDAIWIDRISRIWSHDVYTRYPYQANTFGLPAPVAHECLMGFLEAREHGARRDIRSFEDFIHAHFGAGFARHFMIPYNRKIWGVHPRDMTPAWCDRFVPIPRLEHVIAGAVGMNEQQMGYNASFLYPKKGIGVLTTRIARDVAKKTAIEYATALRAVDARKKRARLSGGRWIDYDALISTLPLGVLARMLIDPPVTVARAASKLRVRSLCYLDVALERPAGTPYHWSYVPDPKVPFYRVGSYSNFSKALAPRGCGSLYVELTARNPGKLADVLARCVPWLTRMGLIRGRRDVRFARLRRIPHGYVIYDHAWQKARATLHDYLQRNRILSIGRYGDWNYSAMEDALIAGRDAARSLTGTRR